MSQTNLNEVGQSPALSSLLHALGHEMSGPLYCRQGVGVAVTIYQDRLGVLQMAISLDGNIDDELAIMTLKKAAEQLEAQQRG